MEVRTRLGVAIRIVTFYDRVTIGDVDWTPDDGPLRLVCVPPLVVAWYPDGHVAYPELTTAEVDALLATSDRASRVEYPTMAAAVEDLRCDHPGIEDLLPSLGSRVRGALWESAMVRPPVAGYTELPESEDDRDRVDELAAAYLSNHAEGFEPDEVVMVPMTRRELKMLHTGLYDQPQRLTAAQRLLLSLVNAMRSRVAMTASMPSERVFDVVGTTWSTIAYLLRAQQRADAAADDEDPTPPGSRDHPRSGDQ